MPLITLVFLFQHRLLLLNQMCVCFYHFYKEDIAAIGTAVIPYEDTSKHAVQVL